MHKRFLSLLALPVLVSLCISTSVAALGGTTIDPSQPPADANSSVVISAVSGGAAIDFIELHNQSDHAVNLSGWTVMVQMTTIAVPKTTSAVTLAHLDDWLLSDGYVAIGRAGQVTGADIAYSIDSALNTSYSLSAVKLLDQNGTVQNSIATTTDLTSKWAQRKTGSSGLSGEFGTDFTIKSAPATVRGHGLYALPPDPPAVRLIELYANPLRCGPSDIRLDCHDYIKLYNPGLVSVDLSDYRLRTDSGTSVSGNAFHLDGRQIPAGGYLTIWQRDDGAPLSLTNTGGYAWLEDAEGIQRYDDSIVSYPDASAESRAGQSWAMKEDTSWDWTGTPTPDGANDFPAPGVGAGTATDTSLQPCPAGKYRSPDTNRCRAIEEAINELATCPEGQARNPATNRCRAVVSTASAVLAPCDADSERNPDTNRCRKVATETGGLAPCGTDEERNPTTNRCRKVPASTALVANTPQATDPKEKLTSQIQNWVIGLIVTGAVGYGIFEWRHEIWTGTRHLARLVISKQ